METIKISLAKPIQALSPLDIWWDECTESGDVLTIVLRNMGTKSLSVGDTILFRRTGTVEKDTRYGDGIDVIAEQEVKVISIENDNTFKVEVPKKKAVLCKECSYSDSLHKWVITTDVEHTIFYQDVKIAQSLNPMMCTYDGLGHDVQVYATNNSLDSIGIASSYTKYTKTTEGCGGNQEVPYEYFFIPIREARKRFLSDEEIPENSLVTFTQNDFYFVNYNGKCVPWTDSGFTQDGVPQTVVGVYKDTGYWNVPVGFVQNADYVRLYEEDRVNTLFGEKVKKNIIPPTINMEKVKYSPVIVDGDNPENNHPVCGLTFNLHFRQRDDNWNVRKWFGWNTCGPNGLNDINFNKSDSLYYFGFTDSDVQYQKMKVKKSFIRLLFYSSNDPFEQKLLYYSTVFLDSGYLFGQFNKKRTELIQSGESWKSDEYPQYVLSAASLNSSDIRIDSQITIHDEFDMTKSSEGFNAYFFADDCEIKDKDKEYRTIYMKVEFNHAGYGKTVPLMVWPSNVSDGGVTIEEYFKNVYIPVKICHIDNKYYYYFDSSEYVICDEENKSITFNLFEPKIIKETNGNN